ncbi:MAG: hypothetical protein ABI876_18370, partial [Bacteroidota bacterium]
ERTWTNRGITQFRAFDFRVMRGGRVVAGTVARTIPAVWDRSGWTERLREAICTASRKFDGPLPEPYEPWHYAYHPKAGGEMP